MKLFFDYVRKLAFILCLIPLSLQATSLLSESFHETSCPPPLQHTVPNVDFNDPELAYNNLYAVHMTSILSEHSKKIPGALSSGLIRPQGKSMNYRATLHHCLGSPVPAFRMGGSYFDKGKIVETPSIHNYAFIYAYLDRLRNFKGEIAGGTLCDIFTVTNHFYGKESIIIIPETAKSQFHLLNPTYEGELILYPLSHDLREVVKKVLHDKSSWCFDFYANYQISDEDKKQGYGYELKCRFYPGDRSDLLKESNSFFEKQNFYCGSHHLSYFRRIEIYSYYFDAILRAKFRSLPNSEIWEKTLSKAYIPILKALILRGMEEVFALPFSEGVKSSLNLWKQDLLSFITLHEFDSQLRQEKQKSLFTSSQALWHQILEARSSPKQLKLLAKGLSSLHPSELAMIESQGFRWKVCNEKKEEVQNYIYIPSYFEKDRLFFVNASDNIYDFKESDSQLIKSYWLLQTYFIPSTHISFQEIVEKLAHYFPLALKNDPTFFTYYLYHSLILRPEKTLTLFNEASLTELLKETFAISYKGEMTLEVLVKAFPQFKILFDESDDLVLNYVRDLYIKNCDLLKVPPLILDFIAYSIHSFVRTFYSQPIDYPQTQPSLYKIEKAYKLYPSIYACEESPEWDFSLLFENLYRYSNIHEAFMKKFPTREQFLNYRKRDGRVPTFRQVYKELMKSMIDGRPLKRKTL